MQAVLFCVLSIQSNMEKHIREVFVMPADGLAIHHISSPCASCNCELSKKICYALANHTRSFEFNGDKCYIMEYRIFDWDYVHQYKEPPLVNFTLEMDKIVTIHVYEWKTACSLKKHKTEDKRAIVLNMRDNQPVTINVFYCSICDKYWLHKSALADYQKCGIYPFAHLKYMGYVANGYYEMRAVSDLKLYGYYVSYDGPHAIFRHAILEHLIYSGLFTRREVVEHIEFCINVPGRLPGREWHRSQWEVDQQYVIDLPVKSGDAVRGYLAGL